ncbi:unnamed protein product [Onchocerca flexuosa]|uniref:Secreted protein n=1 Tax=Onchocerca flexuosa TaxID=387005 RepID=A0A183HUV2_9BILA|nr:unnamed protein product [Onchocerca flexuosa]
MSSRRHAQMRAYMCSLIFSKIAVTVGSSYSASVPLTKNWPLAAHVQCLASLNEAELRLQLHARSSPWSLTIAATLESSFCIQNTGIRMMEELRRSRNHCLLKFGKS